MNKDAVILKKAVVSFARWTELNNGNPHDSRQSSPDPNCVPLDYKHGVMSPNECARRYF
jgi:hypothetical protein